MKFFINKALMELTTLKKFLKKDNQSFFLFE